MSPEKAKSIKPHKSRSSPKPGLSDQEMGEAITKAMSALYPRVRALESYTQQLQDVDEQAGDIVKRTINQATWTYWSAFTLYALNHILPLSLIGCGLYFSIYRPDNISLAIFCIVSGIIALIVVSSRNPLKNVRNLMLNAMKLNIVYSGYTRQIHQIDVAFKELFSNSNEIDPLKLEEMLKYLQDAIDEATNAISEVANDIE
jgi:hypothetical protein